MLRVAGLPVDAVEALRAPEATAWAARAAAEEDALAALAARLGDPLAAAVAATGDTGTRRRLLALRRAIFNNRLPADPDAARALAAHLTGEAARDLGRWLDARLGSEATRAEGEAVLGAALARTRAALRELAGAERLRRGLLLASPVLEERLDAFVAAAPAAVPGKRARKMERSLLSYVYRTACKTSPFSTLTGVALGRFSGADGSPEGPAAGGPGGSPAGSAAGGGAANGSPADGRAVGPVGSPAAGPAGPRAAAPAGSPAGSRAANRSPGRDQAGPGGPDGWAAPIPVGAEWTGHPRLNVVVLSRLAGLVAADPERRADLPVAPASGWTLEDGRVRFVQRALSSGDDSAPVSFDAARDRLFFLRRRGALDGMLALLRDRAGAPDRPGAGVRHGTGVRHGELARWLAAATGADEREAGRYLGALLDLGMLQLPALAVDVHAPDPLRAFQESLRALDRPWADALAARLDGPAAALARLPAADVPGRRTLLAALRAGLLAIQRELGADRPTLPRTLVYEDVSAGTVTTALGAWHGTAIEPLRSLGRVLPAFDVALPQRLTLKGFFLARYGSGGRCEDLLRLVHDFHEDIFRQYLQFTGAREGFLPDGSHAPEENWLGVPEITAIDRARAALTTRMREAWARLPPGAEELRLGEEVVAEVAEALGGAAPAFQPYSHFLQAARLDGAPVAVLNNSFGGVCFPFTRFTHCFDAAPGTAPEPGLTASLRTELRRLLPPGAVFAEVTAGRATTNLNLHSRLTDHEIVCPGETGTAPERARLHLDDLYAVHDPAEDRLLLRSRRLDREVVPLYLGYLVPMVLPEIPRTLLLFSPTSRPVLDVWRGVPAGPADAGVTRRPRVRHHGLVLQRRSWTAAPGSLPPRAPATGPDAAWLLAWHRWRVRHGLPARAFATVHGETAGPPDGTGADGGPADGTRADTGGAPADAEGGAAGGGAAGGAWFGGSKPQYVDFDSPLSLTALEALLTGAPARVVFEEALPDGHDACVVSPHGRHVAELAVELLPEPAPRPEEDGPR
jgi:hypothetical protein